MIRSLFKLGCTPIGVDVGTSGIRMLQLCHGRTGHSVVASGYYKFSGDLPSSEKERHSVLVEGCNKLLATYPFVGRKVVVSLPVEAIQYKNIRLPHMPAEERSQAVIWEAADHLQIDVKEATVEHLYAGEIKQGEETRDELILMAVTNTALREHVNVLMEGGLDPIGIDATPTAIARCFSRFIRRESDSQLVSIYVDVGRSCSKVLIMRGRSIIFFKLIDIGGEHLDRSVADHLGLSMEDASELRRQMLDVKGTGEEVDASSLGLSRKEHVQRAVYESMRSMIGELAREIGMCLRYYSVTFRGARPSTLYLLGGEAHEPMLAKIISEQLEMEVQVAQPLEGVNLSSSHIAIERRSLLPEWGVAVGLTMWCEAGARGKRGAAGKRNAAGKQNAAGKRGAA